ncbi:hypothetical protein B0H14DRAFT_3170892 [Mycena olivaceomarginata]|nr:hypothetical protein B0H14DRAFT_3170892 [Mycena olivaceomarginata]
MRIAISDPSSSLLIPTSPIASANASGHPPAWAKRQHERQCHSESGVERPDALERRQPIDVNSVHAVAHAHLNAVATHPTRRRHAPYTALHYESAVLCVERSTIGVASVGDGGCVQFVSFMPRRRSVLSAAVIVPVQGSSITTTPRPSLLHRPAQVSSTSSVGSIAPTGFTSASSTLSHTSRKGAIAGGIVGGIFVLLLGFMREEAGGEARSGVDADEKAGGVTVPKDEDSIESASSSPANPNPQERETVPAIGSPLPSSNVPVMPQTDIAPPIPPPTSDSTAGSPLPSSNAPVMAQTQIAPPIPPPTPTSQPPVSPPTSDPTASWKYYITALPEMPLCQSKIVFAVDASDSTAGPIIAEAERLCGATKVGRADQLGPESRANNLLSSWGTKPEVIFDDAATTKELKSCNMWYLLTDGEVDSPVNFARKALEVGMANTPVVFVITGTTLTSTTDISVGLPVFASAPDAAIPPRSVRGPHGRLQYQFGQLEPEIFTILPHRIRIQNAMEGISIVDTARLKTGGAVYLGRAWHEKHQCFVRIDRLLEQMPPQSIPENELLDLLEDETFKELALSCKARGLPRDMPAIHRPDPGNSPLLSRISRCLEKLTALENTGFNVDILEWSSHRSMSAAEAVSSSDLDQEPEVPKAHPMSAADAASSSDVDQKPKVLKAHSSTSTTGAQSLYNSRATRTSTFVESSTSRTQHSSYATTYTSW